MMVMVNRAVSKSNALAAVQHPVARSRFVSGGSGMRGGGRGWRGREGGRAAGAR